MPALLAQDAARPRSQQVEIGPSSIGFCRLKVFHILRSDVGRNPTDKLAAMMGTSLHESIETGINAHADTVRYRTEVEVPGIEGFIGPGHIDLYDSELFKVTDWKTTKKSGLRFFPKMSQRWQVQIYGYLMKTAGYRVDWVELVAIPRDGKTQDILLHTEAYDEKMVGNAFDWLRSVHTALGDDNPPVPEIGKRMCADYCEFYLSHCPSSSK